MSTAILSKPGTLIQARGREWVVLPDSTDDLLARELLDRGEIHRLAVLCPPHLAEAVAARAGGEVSH